RFGAVPHGAQLRAPAIYPQRLVDALIEEFRERPAVEAAFVAELYVPADLEPPHPVIGILSSVDAFVTICQQVGPIAEQAAGGAGRVDFAYMGHQEADRITTYLRQETTPFYQRVASKPWWKLWK
ncbi:MAG TPA: enhanced serine sensitivity protein SseB C-terminal domain-containing protein, partial [Polyangiaceae bacterium]